MEEQRLTFKTQLDSVNWYEATQEVKKASTAA